MVLLTEPPRVPSSSMDFVRMSIDDYVCPPGEAGAALSEADVLVRDGRTGTVRVSGRLDPAERALELRISHMLHGPEGEQPGSPARPPPPGSPGGTHTVGELRGTLAWRGRRELDPVNLLPKVKDVFSMYCTAQEGAPGGGLLTMEPVEFRLLLQDAGLFGGDVTPDAIRKVYRAFRTQSFHFYQFLEALKMVAGIRRMSLNEAVEQLVRRCHDDGLFGGQDMTRRIETQISKFNEEEVEAALAPEDRMAHYRITVYTSKVEGASTDARVSCQITGSKAMTKPLPLGTGAKKEFEQGSVDSFTVEEVDVGEMTRLWIGHDK